MSHVSDGEFTEIWIKLRGQGSQIAKALNVSERAVYRRRTSIEQRLGVMLPSVDASTTGRAKEYVDKLGSRVNINVNGGVLLAFGDQHVWPGDSSLHRPALIWPIPPLHPQARGWAGGAGLGRELAAIGEGKGPAHGGLENIGKLAAAMVAATHSRRSPNS